MPRRPFPKAAYAVLSLCAVVSVGAALFRAPKMGRQPDGSFIVSSGQRIRGDGLAFNGRPSDFALHPTENVFAVLAQREVFMCSPTGIIARSRTPLGNASAGFHGVLWTGDHSGSNWWPDAQHVVVTNDQGALIEYRYADLQLEHVATIPVAAEGDKRNAYPGGMCATRDSKTLFVAAAGLNAVVEVDLATHKRVRELPVQVLPYDVRLSGDEKTLIVSNWGGRKPLSNDRTAKSGDEDIVTDERGVASTGTVSLVDRATGQATVLEVGIHPNALLVHGNRAYVANGMSDTLTEIDLAARKTIRTISVRGGGAPLFGAMPNALALSPDGRTLYVCNGGDNAVAEVDLPSGTLKGFRPTGYFPCAITLSRDGRTAYVLNSKGNGSVENTRNGNPGSPHDFQGTITTLGLRRDLKAETRIVARNNRWDRGTDRPKHPVYNGAVKHVLYIIKENQTYDSVFGQMKEGNGDPSLCVIGETGMPNHWALARTFTLFDNGYVSGTNSADGHAWSTQSLANDYMEHFYVSYRTYPDDGDCAMSLSAGGALWDAAARKGKKIRVYGEYCDDRLAKYAPYRPKDWFEAWEDRKNGGQKFTYTADTTVAGLKPYICPSVQYWPLIQSDQARADAFLKEYREYSRTDTVPDLMILCLPADHTEGLNPEYPTPRAMHADNDLALGRVVEGITKSPQWKDTCIFVIEDDGQALPDHVDGHRVPYFVISPYTKRRFVDSHLYTTASMLRSIGLMLGLEPMNRFDAMAEPITTCFAEKPDLTPYTHVPNRIPLDERNPSPEKMTAQERYWYEKTVALDWSRIDGPDHYWLNRVNWFTLTKGKRPFPTIRSEEDAERKSR
ncbi:MAG: alkaline phosphatase family protein [Capsulimonadales bacterium]|nr:alkaline phosphatase family protein [Capsulimonadales bacterium]